jgi:hypothetical protein
MQLGLLNAEHRANEPSSKIRSGEDMHRLDLVRDRAGPLVHVVLFFFASEGDGAAAGRAAITPDA